MQKSIYSYRNIYFLGIGGIGMSALARWFSQQGFVVGGYDKTKTLLTETLASEGILIHYDDQVGRIPTAFYQKEETLVVYTPAVPTDNIEYSYFVQEKYDLFKRATVLGAITKECYTIGIAGTHGKTTTSSMVAQLFHHAKTPINAFLGGIANNINSNLLIGEKHGIAVVEADEYDRSFLTLEPSIALITSIDADHLDIYGDFSEVEKSFAMYTQKITEGGTLLLKTGLKLAGIPNHVKVYSYGIENGDFAAKNIRVENHHFVFDFVTNDLVIEQIKMFVPGYHNIENAVGALAIGYLSRLSVEQLKTGIESFSGVKRRFQYHIKEDAKVLVDDYAHHPEELKAFLTSFKKLYADKKVTCIFQPHLFSRTKDFAKEFGESLSIADQVILLDIYPAREKPIEGVTSELIFKNILHENKIMLKKEDLVAYIEKTEDAFIATVGAGDIDTYIEKIKNILISR